MEGSPANANALIGNKTGRLLAFMWPYRSWRDMAGPGHRFRFGLGIAVVD